MNLIFKLLFSKSFKMVLKLLGVQRRMWGRRGLLEGERRLDLSGTDFYLFFFSNVVFAHPCASIDLCFSTFPLI